ncbi:MAG: peptidase C11, partial [Oscillospiraceae bacterium]|nr:peptidase C11 [Oscillospiraceae bacterium]
AARAKRTVITGNGQDTVTIMVYMCGTDLESKYGMGTSDINEMASADIGKNVNIIVFTGGCRAWKNDVFSTSVNQIYKVEKGGVRCLVKDAGNSSMTNPANLASFIQFCNSNFPANRNELIFWDHGGGSLSGYGHDEKYPSSGSMSLKGIREALTSAGCNFDFIGFDACLMATTENAIMLAPFADYMIASEETEPGVGWYYTNWLSKLSANTSMPTLEIGKNIVDDFVTVCQQKCRGQKTTLSVVDLAELEKTVPGDFKAFSVGTSQLMQKNGYKTVSNARSGAREFATSNKIDQVDLVHLAYNMNTDEGRALAESLLGAIKYNRTSSDISNAYGLSIYFPYQRASKVDSAVATYKAIGVDDDYSRCIQQFASMEVGGQAVAGGMSSPLSQLAGASNGGNMVSSDMISELLGGLLSGGYTTIPGLSSGNTGFLGRSLDVDSATEYLTENRFNSEAPVWTENNGSYEMNLPEDQWSLVQDLELNVFVDDGEGYIDLGLDNVFDFTDEGALKGEYDGTWLAINDQPVPYYHIDTLSEGDDYTITGRVPILLNGDLAELILVFDNENPDGYIAGVRNCYTEEETETVAKGVEALQEGDVIDFVCDYYAYDGTFENNYLMGEQMVYDGDVTISNVYLDDADVSAAYLFTDMYCQDYWTPVIP